MSGEFVVEDGVRCVVCPDCAFTFDASHTDNDGGGYSCPACAEARYDRLYDEGFPDDPYLSGRLRAEIDRLRANT